MNFSLLERVVEFVDNFFFLGGEKTFIFLDDTNQLACTRIYENISLKEFGLKIVLFLTIVIPIVMFAVKLLLRVLLERKYKISKTLQRPITTIEEQCERTSTLPKPLARHEKNSILEAHDFLRKTLVKNFEHDDKSIVDQFTAKGISVSETKASHRDSFSFLLNDFPEYKFCSIGNTVNTNQEIIKKGKTKALEITSQFYKASKICHDLGLDLIEIPGIKFIGVPEKDSLSCSSRPISKLQNEGLLVLTNVELSAQKKSHAMFTPLKAVSAKQLLPALHQLVLFIKNCNGLYYDYFPKNRTSPLFLLSRNSKNGFYKIIVNKLEEIKMGRGLGASFGYLIRHIPQEAVNPILSAILKAYPLKQLTPKEFEKHPQEEQLKSPALEDLLPTNIAQKLFKDSRLLVEALAQLLPIIDKEAQIKQHNERHFSCSCLESYWDLEFQPLTLPYEISLSKFLYQTQSGDKLSLCSPEELHQSVLYQAFLILKASKIIDSFELFPAASSGIPRIKFTPSTCSNL
ncbi:DUF648 domain-containing protein [Chlamydiifrater volucris]|uniref:DUF648 domain-containing protein n=1 Tax=Chlamydiifrater volucris TaxID=2681470 RepID=UPI0032B1F89E